MTEFSSIIPQPLDRIKKRADFLRLNRLGRKSVKPGFILLGQSSPEGTSKKQIRIGFTCSKKLGNAVARNRAKRRLRALSKEILPHFGKAGWDYVLIGRPESTAIRNFLTMRSELQAALSEIHKSKP